VACAARKEERVRRVGLCLALVSWLLLGLTALAPAEPGTTAKSDYLSWFETVWKAVDETYFDPAFGGVDWREVHDRYQPLVAAAADDETFYALVNNMLWELDVSHAMLVPPGHLSRVQPTVFGEGEIGVDVRLIGEEAVVTRVSPGSPAATAGLRSGFVIQGIDGTPVSRIAEEQEGRLLPPRNDANRTNCMTTAILSQLYGPEGTRVSVTYQDERGRSHTAAIRRRARSGRLSPDFPAFMEFTTGRLAHDIGYLRLSAFSRHDEVCRAIASMAEAPGLVIDLRGNPGGDDPQKIAEWLVTEPTVLFRNRTRMGREEVVVEPAGGAYEGPVVVLIDALSTSASELFAAGLQTAGRALVVGERSPGWCTSRSLVMLPNGAIVVHPNVEHSAPDGTVLEGRGVEPDVEVHLTRDALLEGRDLQLEAAVQCLMSRIEED
jgi:C-terminal peptidase prc